MTLTIAQKSVPEKLYDGFKLNFENTDWHQIALEEQRRKQEAIDRNEWIVETKIADGGVTVEVSAVIKGSHGHSSWGWHGEHKQVVLATSKTYGKQLPVSRAMLDLAEAEALKICLEK